MAENSILWTTNGVGDGNVLGYDRGTLRNWERATWTVDPTLQGVSRLYVQELELTAPGGLNLSMDTGGGVVSGFEYWNTTPVVIPLVLPLINTTGWRWVLRANWAAQTVRAALLQSADGVAASPNVTQVINVTWEISLAYGDITVGGVITVNDDRNYLQAGVVLTNQNLVDRTMNVLVPGVQSQVGAVVIVRIITGGWPLAAGVDSYSFGNYRIPEDADMTQPFVVTPIYSCSATTATNVRINSGVNLGNVGEVWNTHTVVSGLVAIASGVFDVIQTPAAAAVDIQPVADNNDIVDLFFFRNGAAGTDTFAGVLNFMGWLLTYTRDH